MENLKENKQKENNLEIKKKKLNNLLLYYRKLIQFLKLMDVNIYRKAISS